MDSAKSGKKRLLWVLALVCLGIVIFCVLQTFRIKSSLMYTFIIVAIVELWKDLGELKKEINEIKKK